MGEGWDRRIKTHWAEACGDEESDEGPKRGDHGFRLCLPTGAASIKDKLSYSLGIEAAGVVSHDMKQVTNRKAVVVETRLADIAVDAHPLAKSLKEGRCFGLLTVISRRCNGIDTPEVFKEKVRTSYQTMPVIETVGRTPASWHVALEALNLSIIYLAERDMPVLSPMHQVLSCPDMAASRDLGVASLPECVSELVHVRRWTAAQLLYEFLGFVVVGEHGVLLMSEF